MIKKTIQKRTTSALLWHLGYENDPPIMHNVIATALDMLDDKARADVIQYLSADQPAATENKCPDCPHQNTEHRDGFCSKCECGGYFVIAEPATETALPQCPYGGIITRDACDHCDGPVHAEPEEGCDRCGVGPWDPCDRGVDHGAGDYSARVVQAPQGAPYECNCPAPDPEAVHNLTCPEHLKRFPEDAARGTPEPSRGSKP